METPFGAFSLLGCEFIDECQKRRRKSLFVSRDKDEK